MSLERFNLLNKFKHQSCSLSPVKAHLQTLSRQLMSKISLSLGKRSLICNHQLITLHILLLILSLQEGQTKKWMLKDFDLKLEIQIWLTATCSAHRRRRQLQNKINSLLQTSSTVARKRESSRRKPPPWKLESSGAQMQWTIWLKKKWDNKT